MQNSVARSVPIMLFFVFYLQKWVEGFLFLMV